MNQTSGSVEQKGGSFMLTATTVGPGESRAEPSTVGASGPSAISRVQYASGSPM